MSAYVLSNGAGMYLMWEPETDSMFRTMFVDHAEHFDTSTEAYNWLHKHAKEFMPEFHVYCVETFITKVEGE